MEREMMRRRWRLWVLWDWWFVVLLVGESGGGGQTGKHRLTHAGVQIHSRFLVALQNDSQKSKMFVSESNFL